MMTKTTHPALLAALLGACAALPVSSHAISAPREEIAAFLGTTVEDMEAINPTGAAAPPLDGVNESEITRGTALRRTLSVAAGDTLSFDWFFGTDEGPNGANNNVIDFAFFSVNGALSVLTSALEPLAQPASESPFSDQLLPLSEGGTDFFRSVSFVFADSGDFVLGFAVVDVADTVVESGLIVDNVSLNGALLDNGGFEDNFPDGNSAAFTGWETLGDVSVWDNAPFATEGNVGALLMSGNFEPTPVPVPAAAWLLGSALATLGWRRRR